MCIHFPDCSAFVAAKQPSTSVGDDLETKEKVVKQAPVQSAPAKKETLVKIKQELETLLELLRK